MTSKWPTITLNEIVEHQKGFAFKSKDYVESGTPVVRVSNFTENSIDTSDLKFVNDEIAVKNKTVTLLENDVVIATVGSWPTNPASVVGKTIRVPHSVGGSLLNQNAVRLRVKNESLSDQTFLYYLLKNQDFADYIVSTAQGSASQASITLKDIYGYELQYPNEFEREKIGNHLASIDKKITRNQQINQTLEEMAQAIFKSWFVDFDPVKAKMNGEQPEGMDAATASLFPEKLVESELGFIPEGWEVDSLSSVVDVIMGQSPKGTTYNDQNVGTPLVNGPVEFGVYHPVAQKWTTAPTKLSKDKDLIVCVRGSTTGRYVVSDGEYCLGRGVCSVRSDDYPAFANYLFKSQLNNLLILTTGSTFPSWSGPTLKHFKVVVPPKSIIEKYEAIVGNLCSMMAQNTGENESLASLRDTLLPKLLSGEIELGQSVEVPE